MNINDFKAVIFDFDGVLADSIKAHVEAWIKVCAEYGLKINPIDIKMREGQKAALIAQELFNAFGEKPSQTDVNALLNRKRALYAETGPTEIIKEAAILLSIIKKNGLKLALVTGSIQININRVMKPEERQLFDIIITGDDVFNGKPDPEPYKKAVESLNLESKHCLVVENAPLGIQSAKSAGLKVAAITSTLPAEYLKDADWIINELYDILQILNIR